jgi:hypothetical protein
MLQIMQRFMREKVTVDHESKRAEVNFWVRNKPPGNTKEKRNAPHIQQQLTQIRVADLHS